MGWIASIIYLVKEFGASFSMMSIAVLTLVPANVPGAPDASPYATRPGRCPRVAFSVDNSRDSDNQVGHAGVFDGTVRLYAWLPLSDAR
jgi:hypothetical protein